MAYQVLARKWRPQRFDEVVGQRAVTQTLQNALKNNRIAQAFVFAGPRGVGKTTTARILARALNCEKGPTAQPCGQCEACLEIAEGRDMDVLEIDAATNTQVENVRSVIIEGLAIPPARDRYKIFIIDEVHQLSSHSFNALLKSIEEPPPHAAFIMATTELGKIPETILSRSQVYEFKTIASQSITEQLRKIADAEKLAIDDEALALVARAADGSMRDAETALDQVIAFAADRITVDDVSSVLGLVGRDLLLDALQAVVDEDAAAAFALAARAVESGNDLKLVCRELSRVVRDLMVLSIDPARIMDPDIAPESERARLKELAARFSREDLLRAFDLLTRAESDIRNAAEPRYHLEMALMAWIHLRKLIPLAELIEKLQSEPDAIRSGPSGPGRTGPPTGSRYTSARPTPPAAPKRQATADREAAAATTKPPADTRQDSRSGEVGAQSTASNQPTPPPIVQSGDFKTTFLASIEQARVPFYRTVVAQAQRIDANGSEVVFSFAPVHRVLKEQVEQNKAWLEGLAERAAGRHVTVKSQLLATAEKGNGAATPADAGSSAPPASSASQTDLRAAVLADSTVQALLGIFPAEIRSVEELKDSRRS